MTTVGRTGIDPRIRKRRIEVQRATGRRRLRRLLVLGGLLVTLALAVGVSISPLLDVDRIAIAGASSTPASEVVAASGIIEGDAMVRLDVDTATEAVEALPWVDEAKIRRDFPSAVKIEVIERVPVGILRAGETEALVDASGRVLGPVVVGFTDLARIEVALELPAPGQQIDAATLAALDLAAAVGSGVEGHTVLVMQDEAGEMSLVVDDDIAVRLGDPERIETKIRSLATVLDQVDLTCVATIDIRIADRAVLTRDEPCR
jgi:cell division protein FtsQ